MGRILYGVQTDHGGHLVRSRTIAQQLKGHEVLFVGGDRIQTLERYGFQTVTTPLMGTIIRNNRLDVPATILHSLRTLTTVKQTTERLKAVIRDFNPDLILSDFEYFLPIAAKQAGRDCISIDRQHFITNCEYHQPPGTLMERAMITASLHATRMNASRYFVISFAEARVRDNRNTEIFPPIIRPEILKLLPETKDHVLVYMNIASRDWIRKFLLGRKQKFLIYGQNEEKEEGNLIFRRHDADQFADDLATARFVISHAGHNLISECLYLGKPLLCFPGNGLYEQQVNAHLLEQAGFGIKANLNEAPTALQTMEEKADLIRARLAKWRPWSSVTVIDRLSQLINNKE